MKKLNTLLFNQGGKCFYCDAILDLKEASIEHVIPQSKGGSDNIDNLVVCCTYANHAFRDYSPKHKMTVMKQICGSKFLCTKIFPREPAKIVKTVKTAKTVKKTAKTVKKTAKTVKKNAKTVISNAYKLLVTAVKSFENEVTSSQLKQKMLALNPKFKESEYGFNQFNKFLLQAQEEKIILLEKNKGNGNHYIVTHDNKKQ